ncbi:hypothetical protein Mcate_02754 [Meiothermus taiwanensis]|uniref:Uncharacterized protein n=1 Tax=Meiothermus taiwanensis TaxID=172827 RepID=A0A399DSE2_9DEIN|nr:hypothetical protein Mcate_02754 [Meiothermus taiwanensis]
MPPPKARTGHPEHHPPQQPQPGRTAIRERHDPRAGHQRQQPRPAPTEKADEQDAHHRPCPVEVGVFAEPGNALGHVRVSLGQAHAQMDQKPQQDPPGRPKPTRAPQDKTGPGHNQQPEQGCPQPPAHALPAARPGLAGGVGGGGGAYLELGIADIHIGPVAAQVVYINGPQRLIPRLGLVAGMGPLEPAGQTLYLRRNPKLAPFCGEEEIKGDGIAVVAEIKALGVDLTHF